jgi:F420-dependent oxidoreductase-like protein
MKLRIFTEPQQGADYQTLRAVALAAEELGFDAFFRSDHYLAMSGSGRPGPTDSWVTLGALAVETRRIRLGTLVTAATFRLPGPLAISVAQVDQMSGGRVEIGIGTGWFEREHAAYGIPFPALGERFDRFEEQLAIVTGLWETPEGETFSFAGTHYRLEDSPALPKPAQRPRPPVILGGSGARRTPRLAARFADEYNVPFLSVGDSAAAFARVREACEAAGRQPSSVIYSVAQTVCCGKDEAEFRRRAAAIGWPPEAFREAGIGGTPGQVAAKIAEYATIGAERVYLQVLDLTDLDHLALIASDVVPQVQRLSRSAQAGGAARTNSVRDKFSRRHAGPRRRRPHCPPGSRTSPARAVR